VALGWYSGSVAQNDVALEIVACKSGAAGSRGLLLTLPGATMQPASYTTGTAQWRTGQGQTWTNELGNGATPIDVTVTPSTGPVVGSFSVTVRDAAQAPHTLTGEFSVCRPPITLPPHP
jgi:hypothetical protein